MLVQKKFKMYFLQAFTAEINYSQPIIKHDQTHESNMVPSELQAGISDMVELPKNTGHSRIFSNEQHI